jgi:8-oxo-dGTP diphosphatase
MEVKESAADTGHRELTEETGLTAHNLTFLGICPFAGGVEEDLVVLGFTTDEVTGELVAGDDAMEARFFPVDQYPRLAFRCHREIMRMYLSSRAD